MEETKMPSEHLSWPGAMGLQIAATADFRGD